MAERLRKSHQDDVRTKIQVSQLLNVLQNHALGKSPDLSPSRLRAIEILLKKTLPDLSSQEIEHSGEVGLIVQVVKFAGEPK